MLRIAYSLTYSKERRLHKVKNKYHSTTKDTASSTTMLVHGWQHYFITLDTKLLLCILCTAARWMPPQSFLKRKINNLLTSPRAYRKHRETERNTQQSFTLLCSVYICMYICICFCLCLCLYNTHSFLREMFENNRDIEPSETHRLAHTYSYIKFIWVMRVIPFAHFLFVLFCICSLLVASLGSYLSGVVV